EVYPFTIAPTAEGEESMILMCKKPGGWTNKLYDLAKSRQVKVCVDGPYKIVLIVIRTFLFFSGQCLLLNLVGGPGHRIFSSFSAAVFVAGRRGMYNNLLLSEMLSKMIMSNCLTSGAFL
ncbi:hypothetical protein BDP27DRAFT_1237234, partial [Rhodocollybia butyracea]